MQPSHRASTLLSISFLFFFAYGKEGRLYIQYEQTEVHEALKIRQSASELETRRTDASLVKIFIELRMKDRQTYKRNKLKSLAVRLLSSTQFRNQIIKKN
jgi:hypothetical protein